MEKGNEGRKEEKEGIIGIQWLISGYREPIEKLGKIDVSSSRNKNTLRKR